MTVIYAIIKSDPTQRIFDDKKELRFNTTNGFLRAKQKIERVSGSVTQFLTTQYFNGHWLSTQTKETYLRGTDLAIDSIINEQ